MDQYSIDLPQKLPIWVSEAPLVTQNPDSVFLKTRVSFYLFPNSATALAVQGVGQIKFQCHIDVIQHTQTRRRTFQVDYDPV